MKRRLFTPVFSLFLASAILLTLWSLAVPNARADATITVDSVVDNTLGNLSGNGTCDLREAIEAANTDAAVDVCTAGDGADTIVFDAALTASQDVYIALRDGDTGEDDGEYGPAAFTVSSPITVQGPSGENGVTLWASFGFGGERRHFHVTPSGELTLENMTLMQGIARGGSGGSGNAGGGGAAGMGGAILNEGTLNVVRSTFAGNTAYGGHGHPNQTTYGSGGGGGLAASGQNHQNDPGGDGGAPNGGDGGPAGGDATAGGNGGGGGGGGGRWCACHNTGGDGGDGGFGGAGGGGGHALATGGGTTATGGNGGDGGFGGGGGGAGSAESASGSAQTAGSVGTGGFGAGDGQSAGTGSASVGGDGGGGAGMGGAIFNYGGTVNVETSTFSGNVAWGGSSFHGDYADFADGGPGDGYGGAIFNYNGAVTVNNSTIVSNTVVAGEGASSGVAAGAGVYNLGDGVTATLALSNSIVANSVGANSLVDTSSFTVVMDNFSSTSDFVGHTINAGTSTTSGDNNQIEDHSGFDGQVISGDDPQLGLLQDNTGATNTHAPLPGSVVIDAGLCGSEATDQRGVARPTDGEPNGSVLCDIGAVEFDPDLDPVEPSAGEDYRIGDRLRVSDMGPDGNTSYGANRPAVAYNSSGDEYLVVWYGDDDSGTLLDNEFEIFAQRVDAATGAEVGSDFRISSMGPDGDGNYDAQHPRVAYNATENEYLVVWYGDHNSGSLVDNEIEVFGQRVDAATGALSGDNFRVSDMGTDSSTTYAAQYPDVAWNATENAYLVVWQGDDDSGALVDNHFEIYGQRLDGATGAEVGGNDFRISVTGADDDNTYRAEGARAAWNATGNEYLVVWRAEPRSGAMVDNEYEIYGQRLNGATGAEVGDDDFRISSMGPDGDSSYEAGSFGNPPNVVYNPPDDEYMVTWWGSDTADNGSEIYGQRLDAATGAEVGDDDFLISDVGLDRNTSYNASSQSLAYDGTNHEYMVVWYGDDWSPPLVVDNEFEIFGQRLDAGTGAEVGPNDFRISAMGPDGNKNYAGFYPQVAANSTNEEYLVVWQGDDDTPPLVDGENEIFAQRYGAPHVDEPLLAVSKTASDDNPTSGDSLTYTVVVDNSGSGGATSGVVSDTIPAGLAFVTGSTTLQPGAAGTTGDAPTLVSDLTIGAGETITVTYGVTVTAASGPITNTAGVSSAEVTEAVTDAHMITVEPFVPVVYELSVTVDGDGSGTVSSTPAGIDCGVDCSESYDDGTVVTLSATYDSGDTTLAWGGACAAASGDTCELTMDQAHDVTATFSATPPDDSECVATGSGNWSEVFPACAAGAKYIIPAGMHVVLDQDVSLSGDFELQGTLDPNGMTVTLTGGLDQTLTGDPLTFYELVVSKDTRRDLVLIDGKLEVSEQLSVLSGHLRSASDYHHVEIGAEGVLELTSDITVSGDWRNDGEFIANGHTVTFDGDAPQTLEGAESSLFYDLAIAAGADVAIAASPGVTNTVANHGLLRQTQTLNGSVGSPASFDFLQIGGDKYQGASVSTEANLGLVTVSIAGNDGSCAPYATTLDYRNRCFEVTTENGGGADVTFYTTATEDDLTDDALVQYLGGAWTQVTATCGDDDGASCAGDAIALAAGDNFFLIAGVYNPADGAYMLFLPWSANSE